MHDVEGEMEADDKQPEMPLAEPLVEHAPGHLRVPVIKGRKDHEDDGADEHVMEMRHYEIGIVQLPVPRRYRKHDPRQPGNHKLEQERDRKQHGQFETDLSTPDGRQPIEGLDACGNGDDHRRQREEGVAERSHADGEHVVRPYTRADERDAHRGGDHGRVAEDGFAREDGNDLVGEREGGQHEYVNFGVAEDPEEMRPQDSGAAGLGVEEVTAEVAVDEQHGLRGRKRADGDQDEERHGGVEPRQERDAQQGHSLAAHAENGGDDVDAGADAADAAGENGHGPVVDRVAGRKGLLGEWSIGEPGHVGSGPGASQSHAADETVVKQNAAKGADPEAERVEARKGHVARADHQGHKIVAEAEAGWACPPGTPWWCRAW